jgi:hypothetical protein
MVKRSTFNRDGESSILSGPTKVLPVSSSGLGSLTFTQQTGVQFSSPVPSAPSVPFVQRIRIERYERSDSGSSPERDTKCLRSGGRAARHLTVYEDQVGSTPIHFAKFDDVRLDGSGRVTELV